MWYVYIIKSLNNPFRYIGFTGNVMKRLEEHNLGLTQSTKHCAPYDLEAFVAVKTREKAIALEKYFKTGSGKAVLKKRILG
jgi:putative endonuclease